MYEPQETLPSETFGETGDEMDTLGGRLLRAREASGMSEAALARRIGVKTSTLTAWESDRSEPRANKLSMVAGMLNVSLQWLLFGVGPSPESDSHNDFVRLVSGHLERIKRLHDETALTIKRLEAELARHSARPSE